MRLSEISRTIDIYNKRLYNENMESMPTVYLDMDGVLADFFGGIEKLYGVQHWKELTSDKTKDLKTEVIKKITGTNFFETLPKFNTADQLVKIVQDFTGGIYSINTSPLRGDNKNSAYYKKVWIGKNLPKPQEIIVTGRKESYAMNPNKLPNILVDDRPINIQRWTGRGGYGILYQANRDSVDKVKNGLEEYKKKYRAGKDEAAGVGIVTKQNATKDVPVGGQYMNVKKLKLGNIDIYRDWGWAPDYVIAMHKMLQNKEPNDYIIATGKTISLSYIVEKAFEIGNLSMDKHLEISDSLKRPCDLEYSALNPEKIFNDLGWECKVKVDEIVRKMFFKELF